MKAKYKVGDKVAILETMQKTPLGPSFTEGMMKLIGKEQTIRSVMPPTSSHDDYWYSIATDHGSYTYRESWLRSAHTKESALSALLNNLITTEAYESIMKGD